MRERVLCCKLFTFYQPKGFFHDTDSTPSLPLYFSRIKVKIKLHSQSQNPQFSQCCFFPKKFSNKISPKRNSCMERLFTPLFLVLSLPHTLPVFFILLTLTKTLQPLFGTRILYKKKKERKNKIREREEGDSNVENKTIENLKADFVFVFSPFSLLERSRMLFYSGKK